MRKILTILITIVFATSLLLVGVGCKEETAPAAEEPAAEEPAAEEPAAEEPAAEEEQEPITIGFLSGLMSIVWEQDMEDELMAFAAEDNASIITMDSAMDPAVQMDQLTQLIGMGVDGIVVFISDEKMSEAVATECYNNDVAVMFESVRMIDEEGKLVAPGVELDGYGMGVICAEWAAGYLEEQNIAAPYDGWGIINLDNPDSYNIHQRADGVEDTFFELVPDFPEENHFRAEMVRGKGGAEAGYDAAMATITANPDITKWIAFGPNDDQGGGAARALEQARLDKDSFVVSMGAEMARDEWKKEEDTCWKAASFFSAYDCASLVWEGMMQLVRGGVAHEELWPESIEEGETYALKKFTGTMVTKDNFMEIMGSYAE